MIGKGVAEVIQKSVSLYYIILSLTAGTKLGVQIVNLCKGEQRIRLNREPKVIELEREENSFS